MKCCFTGHRDTSLLSDRELIMAIKSMINDGVTHFIAGGAEGFDTRAMLFALGCRREGFKYTLVLPYRGFGMSDGLRRFVHDVVDEVVCLQDKYSKDCFKNRNQYMVDNSDSIIAFVRDIQSGSGQTLRMAEKKGILIKNV